MPILGHTVQVPGGEPVTIYAEPQSINWFLQNELEPDALDGPTNAQASVGGYQRRMYPGDSAVVSVTGHQREYLVDPSRGGGSALPGRNFTLRTQETDEEGRPLEQRTFTYKGRWIDLHAFISAEAGMDLFLYNSTGAGSRSTIASAATP